MKNLIAPVIVALLIVATLALATHYILLPAIDTYVKSEAKKINEADTKLKALQLVHSTTPGGGLRMRSLMRNLLGKVRWNLKILFPLTE